MHRSRLSQLARWRQLSPPVPVWRASLTEQTQLLDCQGKALLLKIHTSDGPYLTYVSASIP